MNCPGGKSITVAAGQNVNFNALCQTQQQIVNIGPMGGGVPQQPVVVLASAPQQPAVVVQPQVAGVSVAALPKTGLPFLAWSALAFIPAGFGLRRFKKLHKDLEDEPTFIWEDRKFKAGS